MGAPLVFWCLMNQLIFNFLTRFSINTNIVLLAHGNDTRWMSICWCETISATVEFQLLINYSNNLCLIFSKIAYANWQVQIFPVAFTINLRQYAPNWQPTKDLILRKMLHSVARFSRADATAETVLLPTDILPCQASWISRLKGEATQASQVR